MKTLWTLPVASTALLGTGPALEMRLRRDVALSFAYEGDEDGIHTVSVVFQGVEAFKCTYHLARDKSVLAAYDKVVDVGSSPWLEELRRVLDTNRSDASGLAHLMIDFDDGPTYEFVCRSFRIDETVAEGHDSASRT